VIGSEEGACVPGESFGGCCGDLGSSSGGVFARNSLARRAASAFNCWYRSGVVPSPSRTKWICPGFWLAFGGGRSFNTTTTGPNPGTILRPTLALPLAPSPCAWASVGLHIPMNNKAAPHRNTSLALMFPSSQNSARPCRNLISVIGLGCWERWLEFQSVGTSQNSPP